MYLYFPERFYNLTDQLGSLTNQQSIANQFYDKHNLRSKFPEFVAIADETLKNGHYVDVADVKLNALLMLVFAYLYKLDDTFEEYIHHPDQHYANFAISLWQSLYDGVTMPKKRPSFPKYLNIDNSLIERGQLFCELIVSLMELVEQCLAPSHFRAFVKTYAFYAKNVIQYESVVRRLMYLNTRPMHMIEYMITRPTCVGYITTSPFFLDEKWDLDRNFEIDSYLYRMSSVQVLHVHDLLSAPKEQDTVNHVKLLEATGFDRKMATLRTADVANQVMKDLEDYHDQCPVKRNFIYGELRSIYQITNYQVPMSRYGWKPIN